MNNIQLKLRSWHFVATAYIIRLQLIHVSVFCCQFYIKLSLWMNVKFCKRLLCWYVWKRDTTNAICVRYSYLQNLYHPVAGVSLNWRVHFRQFVATVYKNDRNQSDFYVIICIWVKESGWIHYFWSWVDMG